MTVKIMTVCRMGISRSVGMADVLKLHFEPVDVLPVGYAGNTPETLLMIAEWADKIVIMQEKYRKHFPPCSQHKILVCDVGPDIYQGSKRRMLIDKCWQWLRSHHTQLGITEHNRKV